MNNIRNTIKTLYCSIIATILLTIQVYADMYIPPTKIEIIEYNILDTIVATFPLILSILAVLVIIGLTFYNQEDERKKKIGKTIIKLLIAFVLTLLNIILIVLFNLEFM